jgi:DNA mismatch endonuclease (patch repair protein)
MQAAGNPICPKPPLSLVRHWRFDLPCGLETLMDNLTPEARSLQMSLVRSKDTKPELKARRLIHRLGFRYRLHRAELPGKPDLVFSSRRKVIFVHGCFWHGHNCKLGRMPKSNLDYWRNKIAANMARDRKTLLSLRELGWKCLTVWECNLNDEDSLAERIRRFLESAPHSGRTITDDEPRSL